MSSALIKLVGTDLFCSIEGGPEAGFAIDEATQKLCAWSKRYDEASRHDREGELSAIGSEMFAWLDSTNGWATAWTEGPLDRALEIEVTGAGTPAEIALLDAPWELLSRPSGPLALDDVRLFIVARRIGSRGTPLPPRHADFQLMFMAAAPIGQRELDFEAEEAGILRATERLPIRLVVEESGALEFLSPRLAEEGPFEALHLSCHGEIDAQMGPVLLLEGSAGESLKAGVMQLSQALGADRPPLVMLSACRTAEFGSPGLGALPGQREGGAPTREGGAAPRAAELATPFARKLATILPNVVGWDGSVYDVDATEFATQLYKELAARSPVPRAAAVARRALLLKKGQSQKSGRHWHLARIYLGPGGGGRSAAAPSAATGTRDRLRRPSSIRRSSACRSRRARNSSGAGARSKRCCGPSAKEKPAR